MTWRIVRDGEGNAWLIFDNKEIVPLDTDAITVVYQNYHSKKAEKE
jgi:hypothetical protein